MNKDNKNIIMLYENAMQQPTMTVDTDGNKIWRLNDKLHREDGPAVEGVGGTKSWFLHGKRHREDGPAIDDADGNKVWYLNGSRYEDVFEWAEALLKLKGINDPSEDQINDVVQQVTSSSILD
jgi:hypothetical protein